MSNSPLPSFPPTVIVVHPKERRRKCTVNPLRGQAGFAFWKYPKAGPEPLENYVRLGMDGPPLSSSDADQGLLILDGTWRFADVMEDEFSEVPVRSLPPWQTAYPRVSKLFDDPAGGLATIEALFAAYRIMGRDCERLLDDYHWADEFLRLNADRL